MNPTLQKSYRQFQDRVRKINQYEEAAGLLYWDLRTGAPKKSVAWRSEVLGMLSAESFHMLVSPEMGELLDVLGTPDALAELDETGRKMVREYRKQYDRSKKIPADEYREYVTLTTEAESVWEEAKKNADYAAFQPYLEKIIAFNRKFVEYWGYEQHPYDALLEDYEPA